MTYEQRLAEHIRVLLRIQGIGKGDFAKAMGYKAAWTTKILTGERVLGTRDVARAAEVFGLTVDDFINPGLSTITDRRHGSRRKGERRTRADRRQLDMRAMPAEQRRAVAAEYAPPSAPPATPEWTPAQREAAATKMKGDPSIELPARHGEYFRSPGARSGRASRNPPREAARDRRRA